MCVILSYIHKYTFIIYIYYLYHIYVVYMTKIISQIKTLEVLEDRRNPLQIKYSYIESLLCIKSRANLIE